MIQHGILVILAELDDQFESERKDQNQLIKTNSNQVAQNFEIFFYVVSTCAIHKKCSSNSNNVLWNHMVQNSRKISAHLTMWILYLSLTNNLFIYVMISHAKSDLKSAQVIVRIVVSIEGWVCKVIQTQWCVIKNLRGSQVMRNHYMYVLFTGYIYFFIYRI